MSTKRATKTSTEADLEARIRGAIKHALPWLPDGAIKHQIKFTFQFGRKKLEVDGSKARAEARLDILLEKDGTPFAILELKRHDQALTAEDEAQGLSYARLVQPPAPLVVVTNGSDVRLVETHTGKPWTPTTPSEEAFKSLVVQASRVADADLRFAIDTLMGTTPAVWMQAVRHVTQDTIQDLTATWDEPALPFIQDFLIPRAATLQLYRQLDAGAKLLVLEGAPLAGKSNVLRELSLRTGQKADVAMLYVEAGVGGGVLQTLADALARSLSWPISTQEARDWLIRVSKQPDVRLVLAFDGLDISDSRSRREIEDLSSTIFGPSLTLLVAVDESVTQTLLATPNMRSASVVGRRSNVFHVGQLSDFEFRLAREILIRRRVTFMAGAEMAHEYREPWVLRAVCGPALDELKGRPESQAISLPSLLGLKLIERVRERFAGEPELRRRFRGLAKAFLNDAQDTSRPPDLALQQMEVCLLRREAAKRELEPDDLQWLIAHGFLRSGMHDVAGATVLVRLPELLASETAQVLADEIIDRVREDQQEAAEWLAGAASNLPLGEIVAAQAILDATKRPSGIPIGLIDHLVQMPPERETMDPDGRYAMLIPGGEAVEISFEGGKGTFIINGERHEIESSDEHTTWKNFHSWMVLSHLACMPFEVERDSGPEREDGNLLLTIGTSDVPLRASRGPMSLHALPAVDLPGGVSVVAKDAGIIEPVSMGILAYVTSVGQAEADDWISKAVSSDSIPLLARITSALSVLVNFQTHARTNWADTTLTNFVLPRYLELVQNAESGAVEQ